MQHRMYCITGTHHRQWPARLGVGMEEKEVYLISLTGHRPMVECKARVHHQTGFHSGCGRAVLPGLLQDLSLDQLCEDAAVRPDSCQQQHHTHQRCPAVLYSPRPISAQPHTQASIFSMHVPLHQSILLLSTLLLLSFSSLFLSSSPLLLHSLHWTKASQRVASYISGC